MKERPIIMTAESVRATLEDRKTNTRRTRDLEQINKHPDWWWLLRDDTNKPGCFTFRYESPYGEKELFYTVKNPYGVPSDRLWVKEAWQHHPEAGDFGIPSSAVCHAADFSLEDYELSRPWKPSIFMPRWASRLTLEIVNIRIERVQAISKADVLAEGVKRTEDGSWLGPLEGSEYPFAHAWEAYSRIWNQINARRGYPWDSNPWVWVIQYKRVTDV